MCTVEPGDSKPVDSKLQELVNFLLLTKIGHYSNNMIDSKHLAIVNIFAPLRKFTKVRFDCISKNRLLLSKGVYHDSLPQSLKQLASYFQGKN